MQQLSVTKKEKFKLSNKLQEKIFHIRLQTSNQVIKKSFHKECINKKRNNLFIRKLIFRIPLIL